MKNLVLGTMIISLAGCALSPMGGVKEMTQGVKIDTRKFESVEFCSTQKPDLIELIGQPQQQGVQSGYSTVTWKYAKVSIGFGSPGSSESQFVVAFFNDQLKLVDYAINPVGLVQVTDNCK